MEKAVGLEQGGASQERRNIARIGDAVRDEIDGCAW